MGKGIKKAKGLIFKWQHIQSLQNKMHKVIGHISGLMRKALKPWETRSFSLLKVGNPKHKTNNRKSLHFCEQDKETEIYELIILFLMIKIQILLSSLFIKQISLPAFWQLNTSQKTLFINTNFFIIPKKSSFQSTRAKG